MTRTTPELAPPSPNFRATPTGGRLATTYDLACNRPHTRRIFSGIGFRTCDPPIFGALLSEPLKQSDGFYGTGETFLFTFHPSFKVFKWTGANNFFINGRHDCFSIGVS
ncbi:Oxidation resistance protein 1, partial [Araneus ventricosus]